MARTDQLAEVTAGSRLSRLMAVSRATSSRPLMCRSADLDQVVASKAMFSGGAIMIVASFVITPLRRRRGTCAPVLAALSR